MDELKQYNRDAQCPKCGCYAIIDSFQEKGKWLRRTVKGYSSSTELEQNIIMRVCQNCHYSWDESPLDME